ncbi:hypothetical protein [Methylomonas sp. AM2-LC]|uniref:hypothetical protein n=1 Tax=Methylomonas sp. AM2-LC TaxID=3153301 RepID=UPI003265B005
MKIKSLPLIISALLTSSLAYAVPNEIPATITNTSISSNVDNGYGALKWTFGEGFFPELVVGFRHASVSSNGDVYGGDASFAFKIFDGKSWGFLPGKFRLKYFNGADYLQAEVGGGYDFGKNSFFVGIGGQAPFSTLGLDYSFTASNPLEPYFMLNSLGQYTKPGTRQLLSCPSGTQLLANGNCAFNQQV